MKALTCPKGHGPMKLTDAKKSMTFRGLDVSVNAQVYVCPECGLEAGTVQSAGAMQHELANAYRAKAGLLTGDEIRELRKEKGLSQQNLAALISVGIASIKRWETGGIQSSSMDLLLRKALQDCLPMEDGFSGGRELSLGRIKIVLLEFERILKRNLLVKGDKFLYSAKYLWYADMLAFRDLGRGMTGATYAALPQGPQLNNYKDLIELIHIAGTADEEPLTDDEKRIIDKIAHDFPAKQEIYDAAHKEPFMGMLGIGSLIPYSLAGKIENFKQ